MFLSCLCGSDLNSIAYTGLVIFLSCLCGSDLLSIVENLDDAVSKLPMRQ